jgi:hypothetical protein
MVKVNGFEKIRKEHGSGKDTTSEKLKEYIKWILACKFPSFKLTGSN